MRQITYLRLSEKDDESTSIVRQRRDAQEWAQRSGATIVAELVDDGRSGREKRDKAHEALRMLADGEADVLVVWKIDRFGRRGIRDLADLQDVLDARPDALAVGVQDGLRSDSPAWDVMIAVLAGLARAESNNTKARVASAVAYMRQPEVARFAGGTVPYGYTTAAHPAGAGRTLVLDPAEAALVQQVARRVLAGESRWRIARELNDLGVPSPRSEARRRAREGKAGGDRGEWTDYTLTKILTGPHLRGYQMHHGRVVVGTDGLPARMWPPVLDDATCMRLVDMLRPASGEPAPRRRRAARLLSGLVFCEQCGRVCHVRSDSKSAGGATYRCTAARAGRVCVDNRIGAGSLEDFVTEQVLGHLGDAPETVSEVVVVDQGAADLAEVERAIGEVTAAMGEDDADVAQLAARLAELKALRAEARARPTVRETRTTATGRTLASAWAEAGDDMDQRRDLLVAFGVRVHISPPTRRTNRLDPARVRIEPLDAADQAERQAWRERMAAPVRLGS